jgi:Fe-S-cluster containining protein
MAAYLLGGRPIHFPFPSGVLRYHCNSCDAPCCRGATLGIGRSRELVTLRSVQPKISLFAVPGFMGSSMLSIASPAEACWFLDKKDRCRLHKVAGPEAKPAGCRMFPFQRVRAMGEAVCVLPDFSCPMTVAERATDEGPTSHDELALEMHRTGVPRGGHRGLPPPRDMPWSTALALERAVVEASGEALDVGHYLIFADTQRRLTERHLKTGRKSQLARSYDTIRRVIGAEGDELSVEGTRELIAVTGTLRLMASSLPRQDLPGVLLALSAVLGVYEGMRGNRRSVRTAVSVFERSLPFLYVLSHLGDRPVVRDPEAARQMVKKIPAVRAPLLDVLQHLIDNQEQPVADTLEDILRGAGEQFSPPLSPDSVTMLHGLGKVLLVTGMFVPI